jgi:hypothetical protein
LAENIPLAEVMQDSEISHQAFQQWSSQYGVMRPDDVARLKTLEQENTRRKWLVTLPLFHKFGVSDISASGR